MIGHFLSLLLVVALAQPLGSPETWIITKPGVVTTVVGHTSLADSGSHQRIIDVVGVVNMNTGLLGPTVTLSSVVEAEAVADGIAAYDYVNHQVFFCSDGAFAGTVFYADISAMTNLPPAGYYLNPVAFLGFDPISGSRLIAGVNTPGKNFLIMDKANYGQVTMFQIPATFAVTANDAFDGVSRTYYTNVCTALGQCNLSQWNLNTGATTTFPLTCVASNGYLTGSLYANGTHIIGLQATPASAYSAVLINNTTKACTLYPLTGLPPPPVIVVSSQYGYKSGSLFISITSDVYNAIGVYDDNFKLTQMVKTPQDLFEDIFVHEV